MQKYAQEFSDDVLYQHVDLYVNEMTIDLGDAGSEALRLLSQKAFECGLVKSDAPPLEVWQE